MSIEEPAVRVRLRRKLEELVGVEETDLLMDRPPGGRSALVTKEHLALELGAMESRMDARLERIESRFETIESHFETVESRFEIVGSRFDGKLDTLRAEIERGFRDQAWRMLGAFVAFAAVLGGVFTAAVRL